MSKADIKEFNPIRDIDEEWELDEKNPNEDFKIFRAKRWPSLFKTIDEENKVKYTDFERFVGIDINDPKQVHHSPIARMILDEICPIEFPYSPGELFKIYTEDFFLLDTDDRRHLVLITYIKTPSNIMKRIMRTFVMRISEWSIQEISLGDYMELKINKSDICIKNDLKRIEEEVTKNVERKDS